MGRGTLHSPNQPSNHCTVRAQRRFERHGIKVEITLVRSGDAKDAARGDVFKMKQMLLGARLPKGSGSTQARVRTSAPEVLKGAGSNGVRAGSSGALAEVRLRPASPAWAVPIRGAPTPDDNLPVPTQTKVKPPEACAATNDQPRYKEIRYTSNGVGSSGANHRQNTLPVCPGQVPGSWPCRWHAPFVPRPRVQKRHFRPYSDEFVVIS